jgi:hypothetical protein
MTSKSLAATFAAIVVGAVLATSACAGDGKITMLQPYDWTKVPVLFVHGLWDSKATRNPMIHALDRIQLGQKGRADFSVDLLVLVLRLFFLHHFPRSRATQNKKVPSLVTLR